MDPKYDQASRWPAHLAAEESATGLGRSTRVGLALTGSLLGGLLLVSWSGPSPSADERPGSMTPVASTR